MIIAVVGSGGKTTLIKKLAEKYRAEGKTVTKVGVLKLRSFLS